MSIPAIVTGNELAHHNVSKNNKGINNDIHTRYSR